MPVESMTHSGKWDSLETECGLLFPYDCDWGPLPDVQTAVNCPKCLEQLGGENGTTKI
jgi:hypothetical protein